MERQATVAQAVSAFTETLRADMYKIMPGRVVSYDAGQETATIQPGVNDVRTDLDSGGRKSEPWPPLAGVPIAWPRFGGFVIKGSLNPYDPVVLAAFDLDPTAWRAAGRTLKPVDPADIDRHGAGYWFAIPTDLSLSRTPSRPGDSLTIGVDGGQPLITITSAGIFLGDGATIPIALATPLVTLLGQLGTWSAAVASALSAAGFPIASQQTTFLSALGTAEANTPATLVKGK